MASDESSRGARDLLSQESGRHGAGERGNRGERSVGWNGGQPNEFRDGCLTVHEDDSSQIRRHGYQHSEMARMNTLGSQGVRSHPICVQSNCGDVWPL
jgi:hypothetical protein